MVDWFIESYDMSFHTLEFSPKEHSLSNLIEHNLIYLKNENFTVIFLFREEGNGREEKLIVID